MINLRFFDRNDDDHLKAYGLTLLNRPLLSWSIKPKEIAEILYLIEKQQQNGAVLIHCYHGADRTGLIAGMYRIIYQGWPVEEAKAEMQHGPYGYHSIWKNIANLFTKEKVKQVKTHLEVLRKRDQHQDLNHKRPSERTNLSDGLLNGRLLKSQNPLLIIECFDPYRQTEFWKSGRPVWPVRRQR